MATLEARRIADLDCQVITSQQPPRLLLVLCHGFGAPGDDLVPVGAQLLQSFPTLLDQVQIVFPAGPLSLEEMGLPYGRAWWPIDMLKLQTAVQLGEFRELRQEVPPLLAEARASITELISQLARNFDLPLSSVVLGGFSQGAMLATDVTLHLDDQPGGLAIWSGTLINEHEWQQRSRALQGLPVVQSHGRTDPILPFAAAVLLKEMLQNAGAKLQFIEFPGEHTIPPQAMQALGHLLVTRLEEAT